MFNVLRTNREPTDRVLVFVNSVRQDTLPSTTTTCLSARTMKRGTVQVAMSFNPHALRAAIAVRVWIEPSVNHQQSPDLAAVKRDRNPA